MIYIPSHFDEPDRDALHALMRAEPFATLISGIGEEVQVSHVPVMFDSTQGANGLLRGHLAGSNSHWRALATGSHLLIFHGPHRYVSPAWYTTHPSVPTWNYAVVHASGPCRLIQDEAELRQLVGTMTQHFEHDNGTDWRLPDDVAYLKTMVSHIVGFEMSIERLQGKFKLSQNRLAPDRHGVIAALEARGKGDDAALAALMRARDP